MAVVVVAFLDLDGPAFLLLYTTLLVVLGIAGRYLVRRARTRPRVETLRHLKPVELGYLLGGSPRVVMVTLSALLARGAVVERADGGVEIAPGADSANPHESQVLHAVYSGCHSLEELLGSAKLLDAQSELLADTDARLVRNGWLYPKSRGRVSVAAAALIILALLVTGVVRLIASLAAGFTNVLFLVLLMVIGAVVVAKLVPVSSGRIPRAAQPQLAAFVKSMRPMQGKVLLNARKQTEPAAHANTAALCTALFGAPLHEVMYSNGSTTDTLFMPNQTWSTYSHGVGLGDGANVGNLKKRGQFAATGCATAAGGSGDDSNGDGGGDGGGGGGDGGGGCGGCG